MNEIVMPKLSDTMTEGRLVSWKKRVGEAVVRGEVIAEVETDKANMELESFVSGNLLEILVQEGEMVQVGTVIAVIGAAGEQGAEAAGEKPAPAPEAKPEAPPEQPPAQPETEAPVQPAQAEQAEPEVKQPQPQVKQPEPQGEQPEPQGEQAGQAAEPAGVTAGEEPAQGADMMRLDAEGQAPAAPPRPGSEEEQPAGQPAEPYSAEIPGTDLPPARAQEAAPAASAPGRERAAPVVRRRAREIGIDLGQVQGTGPEGRILLQDLEQHVQGMSQPPRAQSEQAPAAARAAKPPQAAPPPEPSAAAEGVRPMSRLRAAVAKTVAESWDKIPHFTVTMEIPMGEAESVRRQLKQSGLAVTVNDLVVKAVALGLQKYPQLNASFTAEGLSFHSDINISIAVGVPDGVLMPVLSGCQRRSLLEISQEGRRLVERARSGSLGEQEMTGGTFSVSNLGMFGVSSFSAIIHPAQAAVLAVGAVTDTPMSCAGVLGSAKTMNVTLSADHRVVDGAYAAQFLVELKALLENPVRLLI